MPFLSQIRFFPNKMKILSTLTFGGLVAGSIFLLAHPAVSQQEKPQSTSKASKNKAAEKFGTAAEQQQANSHAQKLLDRCWKLMEGEIPGTFPQQTVDKVESYRADIVQSVHIGSHSFQSSGTYLKGPDLMRRLSLTMELGAKDNKTRVTLLQVCDGEVLMTLQDVGGRKRLTRRNVRQIIQVAKRETAQEDERNLVMALGLGGVSGLIAGLQRSMFFYKHEVLSDGGFVIDGVWNATYQNHWNSVSSKGQLPAHVPDRVRVEIDKSYLVRRIQYQKKRGDEYSPMVTLEFRNIAINPPELRPPKEKPVTPEEQKHAKEFKKLFQFVVPDGTHPEEITKNYTRLLIRPATPPILKQKKQ